MLNNRQFNQISISRRKKKNIKKYICVFYYKHKKRKNVDNRLIIMRRDSTQFATGIDANTQFQRSYFSYIRYCERSSE